MSIPFWQDSQFYRKQTYLLLLALVLNVIFVYSPTYTYTDNAVSLAEATGGQVLLFQPQATLPETLMLKMMFPLTIITILTVVISIFTFANRTKQVLFGRFAFLMQVACLVLSYLSGDILQSHFTVTSQSVKMSFSYGLIFPVLSLLLIAAAIKLVQRDIKRLKSMDRLR
ncbi:MAG: DUF4293 family protein [Bacteroidia bacterium]|nr:DUF4293 family protein [Bacteroidia bacterium]